MASLEEIFGEQPKPITEEQPKPVTKEKPSLETIFAESAPEVSIPEAPTKGIPAIKAPTKERPTAYLPSGEPLTATQRRERAKKDVVAHGRPILEMGGLLAGEAAGFAAGLPGVAVGAPAYGAVVGGGLGFAAGKNLADLLEQRLGVQESKSVMQELTELPEELLEGAAYSAAGQTLGPALKMAGAPIVGAATGAAGGAYLDDKNRLRGAALGVPIGALTASLSRRALSQQGLAKKAYAKLISELKGTEVTQAQIDKNIRIAKKLEAKIRKETGTDFKFTQGQLTNDASAITLERRLARTGGGEDLSQSQRELSNTILDEYYANKVVGKAKIKDFPAYVEKLGKNLETASKEAEDAVNTEITRLNRHMDEQAMGKSIHGFLSKGKSLAKKKATALYDKIPNVKLPSTNLNQGIDDLIKAEDDIIEPKTRQMMDLINRRILKDNEPIEIGYQVLRKLRSRIGQNAKAAGSGANPNLEDARQLKLLQDQIDDAMEQVVNVNPKIAQLEREARSFYGKEYVPTFRQGSIADVLQKGIRGEDTKIAMANIAKSFNSLDGIDDFIRAIGNDKNMASQAMKDFYSFDLLNAALNKETMQLTSKKATGWLAKNAGRLKKLGIYDDFANTTKMQKVVDVSAKHQDIFNKSVAGKILESDMDTMITNAFRGSKNFAKTARELRQLVKGDKAAEEGLKKAFAENIMKQSETTVPQLFQPGTTGSELEFAKSLAKITNQIKKYTPALREIYKDEPEKIKALNATWKAYLTLGRTARSPIGGGSDTFELFGKSLDIVAGSTAPGKWYAFKTIRDMFDKFTHQQMDVFLRKAMFDPDYAQTLLSIAKGSTPELRLNQLMTAIAYKPNGEFIAEEITEPIK